MGYSVHFSSLYPTTLYAIVYVSAYSNFNFKAVLALPKTASFAQTHRGYHLNCLEHSICISLVGPFEKKGLHLEMQFSRSHSGHSWNSVGPSHNTLVLGLKQLQAGHQAPNIVLHSGPELCIYLKMSKFTKEYIQVVLCLHCSLTTQFSKLNGLFWHSHMSIQN